MVRLLTVFITVIGGCATDFDGRVVGISGQPVPDVDIFDLHRKNSTRTDLNGPFRLTDPIGPVLMHHKDYAPRLLFPVEFSGAPTIRMTARPLLEWTIRPCGRNFHQRGFPKIRLDVPRQYARRTSRDVDYELTTISRSPKAALKIWRNVVTLIPTYGWIKDLVSVDVRPVDLAGSQGYDFRGMDASGLLSRSVSAGDTIISYSGIERDASAAFDIILQSACYE